MSNDANFLSWAFSSISGQTAEIEEKINRLQQAKTAIVNEQATCMNEIRRIQEPAINPLWQGAMGDEFDQYREEAYSLMKSIVTNNYDLKVRMIEGKITELNMQKGFLDVTSSLVRAADDLLTKGEEAAQELGRKISQIKGRLFG